MWVPCHPHLRRARSILPWCMVKMLPHKRRERMQRSIKTNPSQPWSPKFLAPGTRFVEENEDNFSTDHEKGGRF